MLEASVSYESLEPFPLLRGPRDPGVVGVESRSSKNARDLLLHSSALTVGSPLVRNAYLVGEAGP